MKNTQKEYSIVKAFIMFAKAGILTFAFVCAGVSAFAQTATVTKNFVAYSPSDNTCRIDTTTALGANVSFYSTPIAPVSSSDPWVNSALIEYGQPKKSSDAYPNSCLALCAEITCSNPTRLVEGSDGSSNGTNVIYPVRSGDFPIQSVLFEIFKYQQNANAYNTESTPPIRTIALYPSDDNNICRGVGVSENQKNPTKSKSCCDIYYNKPSASDPLGSKLATPTGGGSCELKPTFCSSYTTETTCKSGQNTNYCQWDSDACVERDTNPCVKTSKQSDCNNLSTYCYWLSEAEDNCKATVQYFDNWVACNQGKTVMNFCAAWDGMYEIDGEFGETNGDFGYRTTISSNWPGDGITTPEIELSHTIVYPGKDQIPIQIDVTNVHSVRSSPTVVGSKVSVTTQPYHINYRISKDATVNINIFDASDVVANNNDATPKRHLVNNLPREGEGFQGGGVGGKEDTITTMAELWDGRDDQGRLLPFGNYVVSIQAFSSDEWDSSSNVQDISRTVTRQLSLDPLKITDIEVTGLNKTSTGYAMINYMLTEMATVHFEVYTPGTTFNNLNVTKQNSGACSNGYCSNTQTAITPVAGTGHKVFEIVEQKSGRVKVNNKWDGMCWNDAATCAAAVKTVMSGQYVATATSSETTDYAGVALPDGDYVYLLWAEIPYEGSTVLVNGATWVGVKTAEVRNGILGINRGLPELTVGNVGYSTIGSSPVAHGLDPFIFTYALSRDSYVTAEILTTTYDSSSDTTVGPYVVKTLLDNEIQTAAKAGNKLTWDGLDNNGRYVMQGSYLFRVTARDALFPTKVVTSTVEFPVDLFRVVDVKTTSLLEDATSQATVSYVLSKSMDVTLNIFNSNVVIPNDIREENWPPKPCTSSSQIVNGKAQCMYELGTDGNIIINPDIKPIKTYAGARQGENRVTEFWDGYYELTEDGAAGETQAMYPDGFYPYYIDAKAVVAGSKYYTTQTVNGAEVLVPQDPNTDKATGFMASIPATDRPVGYITVARGPVYFTSIKILPNTPKLYHSSETIRIPTYEIDFSVTRTASVQVQIVSLKDGACSSATGSGKGTICRVLTKNNINYLSTIYDGGVVNKLYWDGKDELGNYVKNDAYQVRFMAVPYPKAGDVTTTIESRILEVDNFQIFDRYTVDVLRDNGSMGMFAYQVSVPMKVAIQIFKPGTVISGLSDGTLIDPADPTGAAIGENDIEKVLVKSIVGVSPNLIPIERVWDGTDSRGQVVPDGIYPYRYVSVLDSYDMDSVTGAVKITASQSEVTTKVADWDKYINLENVMVVNGDSWYADIDWKSDKVTMFYPNPLRQGYGQFEITKAPAPGTVSIKIFNIAGDLVRDGGYECINARGVTSSLEQINNTGGIEPDWTTNTGGVGVIDGMGNFALRCKWDRTNNHGKKVARGLYYAIMELTPTKGNAPKSQKIVKILIP